MCAFSFNAIVIAIICKHSRVPNPFRFFFNIDKRQTKNYVFPFFFKFVCMYVCFAVFGTSA